jgi:regulator of sigma E protease
MTLLTVLQVVIALGVLVFVHELCHFIVARALGMTVVSFTVGFGPEIVGFTRGGVRYAVCWVPLGGKVELKGGELPQDGQTDYPPDTFFGAPWWKRALMALSGPAGNYLFAAFVFTVIVMVWGVVLDPASGTPVVSAVLPDTPAARAGLQPMDMLLRVDGSSVASVKDLQQIIRAAPDRDLLFDVGRGTAIVSITVRPGRDPDSGDGRIGVSLMGMGVKQKVGWWPAVVIGVAQPYYLTVMQLVELWRRITAFQKVELAGPIGIFQMMAQKSTAEDFLFKVGIISTALGMFNLFPIPVLDGGHILFALLEAVTRRKPSRKLLERATLAGLALVLLVFLFATYSDLLRVFGRG